MTRVLAAIAVVLALLYGLVQYAAGVYLRSHEARWRAEVAAERQRAAAAAAAVGLRGDERAENAAPVYLRALTAASRDGWIYQVCNPILGPAGAPVGAAATALLAGYRGDIRAALDATRLPRCAWRVEYERGYAGAPPELAGVRELAQLMVVEGIEREAAGDPVGAAERYVGAIRFAVDVAGRGRLWHTVSGLGHIGGPQLGRLVTATALPPAALSGIEADLAEAERRRPPLATLVRQERLVLGGAIQLSARDGSRAAIGFELPAPFKLLGPRPTTALFLLPGERRFADAEAAVALAPRAARLARLQAIDAEAARSWSRFPFYITLAGVLDGHDHGHALLAVLRAAAALARARAEAGGALPEALPATPDPQPEDPFAEAPLRYRRAPDGRTAVVYSIGPDLQDDGGRPFSPRTSAGDIAIEIGATAEAGR